MLGDEVIHRQDGPHAYLRENVNRAIANRNGIHDFSSLHAGPDETGLRGVGAAKKKVNVSAYEVVLPGDLDAVAVPKHCVGIAHITK